MEMFGIPINPEVTVLQDAEDGYMATWRHLRFIVSRSVEQDGKRWLHASVSRQDGKMPTYQDLLDLKRLCVGLHRTALQVFPPQEQHVNLAAHFGVEVLHLWCCLDGEVTPDFTRGTGGI